MPYMLNLQLFADAGAGAEAAPADTGGAAAEAVESAPSPGEQEAEATTELTPEQLEAEFEESLKGKYKPYFEKRVQSILDTRFKKAKATEAELQKVQPVLDFLQLRYADAKTPEDLLRAMEEDDTLFEQEAMDKGLSVEQLREQKRTLRERQQDRREIESMREQLREQEEQQERIQRFQAWETQAEQARRLFPQLDLMNEIRNDPEFHRLLMAGIDVQSAYQTRHMNEIMAGTLQVAVQQARQKTMQDVAARGTRPTENGVRQQAPAATRPKTAFEMSRDEFEELKKRIYAGEKVQVF